MTYEEFYHEYLHGYREEASWRNGQRLFNILWTVRRDLANAINGMPDLDPFNRDDLIPNCLAWLKENW
jgi:hypothetical protein